MRNDMIIDPPPPPEWSEAKAMKKELDKFWWKVLFLVFFMLLGTGVVVAQVQEFMMRNYGATFHITVEIVKGEKK